MDSTAMEVKEFLHMIKGDGEFGYARNTVIQIASAGKTKSVIEKALQSVVSDKIISPGDQVLRIADLGCGVGPIPLAFISTILEFLYKKYKELKWKDGDDQVPELQLFFNDLPTNDFNLLFKHLDELRRQIQNRGVVPWCFAMAVPGSFYDRLFPRKSLHLLHSNYALHWLSQVPPGLYTEEGSPLNRSNIHFTESSPPTVIKAYHAQFRKDWFSFFNCRAEEVVSGGRVVLVCRSRPSSLRHQPVWELHLLNQAIASLVSEGLIKEGQLDTFNIPVYYPLREDIEGVVQKEGSFEIEHIETANDQILQEVEDNNEKAEIIAKCVRSFSESLVSHHFGEEVLDSLYNKLTQLSFKYVTAKEPTEISSIIVLLRRKSY